MGRRNKVKVNARGRADVKYHKKGCVPYSPLRLCSVLNNNTFPSGHNHCCLSYVVNSLFKSVNTYTYQKKESISTVTVMATLAATSPT